MAVSEAYGATAVGNNFYLKFILWSVASVALFRAIGSTTFGVINAVEKVVEGRVKMRLRLPKWAGGVSEKIGEKWRDGISSFGGSSGRS